MANHYNIFLGQYTESTIQSFSKDKLDSELN